MVSPRSASETTIGNSELTALGELVLDRGRRLLGDADGLGEAIERLWAGAGRIDIGTFQSVSAVMLQAIELARRIAADQRSL